MNQFVGSKLDQDKHPLLRDNNSLHYALNARVVDSTTQGNAYILQNDLSNSECFKFPAGYEYKGAIKLDKDQFAIFLTNGTNSKITLFDSVNCVTSDIVNAPCLNFTDEIKGVYKYHNEERRLYWTEGCKPVRFLDLCDIPFQRENDCQDCEDNTADEVDCEAMNFQQHYNVPCIKLSEGQGNLPNGNYQIAIDFTDDKIRYTDYYIFPEVIKLHSNRRSWLL